MADVFISYARDDEPVARRVARALEEAGLDIWWDADLPAHRAYSEEIERNLADAKAVVVLWSKTASKSQWVRAEADFARNAGKLVQAGADGTMPPMPFNQIQCADLSGWRGTAKHAGWAKLKSSVQALVSGEEAPTSPLAKPSLWERVQPYRWWMAAAIALLVAAATLFLTLARPVDERKPVLAVLPFKSLDARDESLAAGMWEDTRQQIGRNPQLIVLGPNTVEELAKKGPKAVTRAAAYMLEASVRTVGPRIRVNANLVRTKDGAQLWSETFDRRLDDVFALQSEIAGEIEGRIRGRLAERGGTRPENIATSGEVYALYSSARAKLRKRALYGGYSAALSELRQVVRMDPNFAPGWATLSVAEKFAGVTTAGVSSSAPESHARRAIALAPNLASAHAALGFALNLNGPVAESEIRRAVALDPNDFESLSWLGNIYNDQGRTEEALEAYSRAVDIEPLWWPAVLNKLNLLLEAGKDTSAQQELDRARGLGSAQLQAAVAMTIAKSKGDLSEVARIGLAYVESAPADRHNNVVFMLMMALLQLDYDALAFEIGPAPPAALALRRHDPRGIAMVEELGLSPREMFSMVIMPSVFARALIANGRGRELAGMYQQFGADPQELEAVMGRNLVIFAPMLAVALEDTGRVDEAMAILERTERMATSARRTPLAEDRAWLARIYAAQGREDEAIATLAAAIKDGWLPPPPELPNDIALDPPLARLRGDPRFEQLRQEILSVLRRERAELGKVSVPKVASQPSTA